MKTKKILIISSIVGLFIFINLSIATQFNQSLQKTGLITLVQSALADTEGPPYWCTDCDGDPCWLKMMTSPCDNHPEVEWKHCDYVCYNSDCDVHAQTVCP